MWGGGFVRKHSQAQQHRHFRMPPGWVAGLHFKNRFKKKSHFEEMVGGGMTSYVLERSLGFII